MALCEESSLRVVCWDDRGPVVDLPYYDCLVSVLESRLRGLVASRFRRVYDAVTRSAISERDRQRFGSVLLGQAGILFSTLEKLFTAVSFSASDPCVSRVHHEHPT